MGQELLVGDRIAAGAEFIQDFNGYVPVSVACWIIPAESDNVFLYIASDQIDDGNIDIAYGEVLRRLRGKHREWLDPFQVKLVNSSDPVARDAIRIRDRYPATTPTRYQGSSIGKLSIDDAYIYPRQAGKPSVQQSGCEYSQSLQAVRSSENWACREEGDVT